MGGSLQCVRLSCKEESSLERWCLHVHLFFCQLNSERHSPECVMPVMQRPKWLTHCQVYRWMFLQTMQDAFDQKTTYRSSDVRSLVRSPKGLHMGSQSFIGLSIS